MSGWNSKSISECKAFAGLGPLLRWLPGLRRSTDSICIMQVCRLYEEVGLLGPWDGCTICGKILVQRMTGSHMQGLLNIHQDVKLAFEHSQELLAPVR